MQCLTWIIVLHDFPPTCTLCLQVSIKIQADATANGFELTVQGGSVVATAVEIRETGPVLVVEPVNWRLYAGLGAGLGVGLILVIVIAIILGMALYTYKR